MEQLKRIIEKAEHSAFYKWLMNQVLLFKIPFNGPHNFRVNKLTKDVVQVKIPYVRKNLNHIKGIHACALATASEYAIGLLLAYNLDASKYRLILQNLTIDYSYQARTDALVNFQMNQDWLNQHVISKLTTDDSVIVTCSAEVHDVNHNLLCTCSTTWQVKKWEKVRLKV